VGKGEGSSTESKTKNVSSRPKENRGGTAGAVGEDTGGEQEGGLSTSESLLLRWQAFLFDKESLRLESLMS
jgi:hypothetical protein